MNQQAFQDKVALVTGGASGIGEACVRAFAQGGAKVAVVDMNEELGEQVVNSIKTSGGEAVFLRVDVSDAAAVAKMVDDTVAAFGRLDIAVNNAGVGGESNPTVTIALRAG